MTAGSDAAAGGDAHARIPVGVSSCLLGEEVRYDGGHKLDRYVTGVLGRWFEYVPFCPEALAGLGVPRPRSASPATPRRHARCGWTTPRST